MVWLRREINEYVQRSLMLVTALSPVIGYDKASKIAHYAMDKDLTLKAAALQLGFVTEAEFDRIVDPRKMVKPYVATEVATPLRPELHSVTGADPSGTAGSTQEQLKRLNRQSRS
jgi:hypothetical protein